MTTSSIDSLSDAILAEKYPSGPDGGFVGDYDYRSRKVTYWHSDVAASGARPAYYEVMVGPENQSDPTRFSAWIRRGRRQLPVSYGIETVGPGYDLDKTTPLTMYAGKGERKFDKFIKNGGLLRTDESGKPLMHAFQVIDLGLYDNSVVLAERPDVRALLEFKADGSLKRYHCSIISCAFSHPLESFLNQHIRGGHPKENATFGPSLNATTKTADALSLLTQLAANSGGLASAHTPTPSFQDQLFAALADPDIRSGVKSFIDTIEGPAPKTKVSAPA